MLNLDKYYLLIIYEHLNENLKTNLNICPYRNKIILKI